jgi:hypothetical protein
MVVVLPICCPAKSKTTSNACFGERRRQVQKPRVLISEPSAVDSNLQDLQCRYGKYQRSLTTEATRIRRGLARRVIGWRNLMGSITSRSSKLCRVSF